MDTRTQLEMIIESCKMMLREYEQKQTTDNEIGKNIDFVQLENSAKKFNYTNEIMERMDASCKEAYITMMLYFIKDLEEDKKLENSMLHIMKVAIAANIKVNYENELIALHKMGEDKFVALLQDLTRMNTVESSMFVIDVMVMLSLSDINDKDIKQNVGIVFTKLGLVERQIKELFELIDCIVNRSEKIYQSLSKKELMIDLRDFEPYISTFISGIMSRSNKLLWINKTIPFEQLLNVSEEEIQEATIFSKERKKYFFRNDVILFKNMDISLAENFVFEANEVVIKDCEINVGQFDFDFVKCKKISIIGCKVKSISSYMMFNECGKVVFTNCTFEGTDAVKCFEINKGTDVNISNCSFVNFSTNEKESYQYGAYFGCFKIKDVLNVRFEKTKFKDCRAKHWEKGKADCAVGGIYGTKNIYFIECEFDGCKNRIWQYGSAWKDAGYMFEFDSNVKPDFRTCKFTECVEQIDPYRNR